MKFKTCRQRHEFWIARSTTFDRLFERRSNGVHTVWTTFKSQDNVHDDDLIFPLNVGWKNDSIFLWTAFSEVDLIFPLNVGWKHDSIFLWTTFNDVDLIFLVLENSSQSSIVAPRKKNRSFHSLILNNLTSQQALKRKLSNFKKTLFLLSQKQKSVLFCLGGKRQSQKKRNNCPI